jgi:hypothetical protein
VKLSIEAISSSGTSNSKLTAARPGRSISPSSSREKSPLRAAVWLWLGETESRSRRVPRTYGPPVGPQHA